VTQRQGDITGESDRWLGSWYSITPKRSTAVSKSSAGFARFSRCENPKNAFFHLFHGVLSSLGCFKHVAKFFPEQDAVHQDPNIVKKSRQRVDLFRPPPLRRGSWPNLARTSDVPNAGARNISCRRWFSVRKHHWKGLRRKSQVEDAPQPQREGRFSHA